MKIKPILLDGTPSSRVAVKEVLLAVNGRAHIHAYIAPEEIESIAATATIELELLVPTKKDWKGARYTETSGARMPKSYKYRRQATKVTLLYTSRGWALEQVQAVMINHLGGGLGRITLTQKQAALALAYFKSTFDVEDTPCTAE